jgi:uncharacterized protein YjeT (DUF2065 family)
MSSIGLILIISGFATAAGGLVALLFPRLSSQLAFGIQSPENLTAFFIRHWGILIVSFGVLIAYGASDPAVRIPVLIAAAVEKFALGLLVFLGPVKRTVMMTAMATMDGVFAALYVAYLAGVIA